MEVIAVMISSVLFIATFGCLVLVEKYRREGRGNREVLCGFKASVGPFIFVSPVALVMDSWGKPAGWSDLGWNFSKRGVQLIAHIVVTVGILCGKETLPH